MQGAEPIEEKAGSCVDGMAQGKRLAVSVDRFLKKVSMNAGREKEGIFETTLHVRWEEEEKKDSPLKEDAVLTREEAMAEAGRMSGLQVYRMYGCLRIYAPL